MIEPAHEVPGKLDHSKTQKAHFKALISFHRGFFAVEIRYFAILNN
jgi:hypothetical protein